MCNIPAHLNLMSSHFASSLDMGALPGVRLTVRSSHTTRKSATYFSHAIPLRPALAASGLFIFIIRWGVVLVILFLFVFAL
jgi:hypothetical protein